MFENLTQRERILAWSVFSLVPLCLGFMLIFWFIGKYNDNNIQLANLQEQIDRETDQMLAAKKADIRRDYYRSVSLPSKFVVASNEYSNWLKKLVSDDLEIDLKSLTPRDAGEIRYQSKKIGNAKSFNLVMTADLEQLTQFLYRFYSVDLLHRINSLKITPRSTATSGGQKIRTGDLTLTVEIEAISLVDADIARDFTSEYRELARTSEEYQQMIVRRNIFGPANNTPTIAVRPSSSYTSETDIKVSVTANDADDNDLLSFELLETDVEGAKLVQSDGTQRRASLEIPGQPAGTYEFKIAVLDSGFPAKRNEETVSVVFKDRVVKEKGPEPPPKKKFLHARETRITGIVNDIANQWIVWIKVRTTGERFKLQTGDSFELDEKTWTVRTIDADQAVLEVGDRLLTFRPADPFDTPRASQDITKSAESSEKLKADVEESAFVAPAGA